MSEQMDPRDHSDQRTPVGGCCPGAPDGVAPSVSCGSCASPERSWRKTLLFYSILAAAVAVGGYSLVSDSATSATGTVSASASAIADGAANAAESACAGARADGQEHPCSCDAGAEKPVAQPQCGHAAALNGLNE
jgi:hypothetical protein